MANLQNRILVMAGTHQREIDFSHPTADYLIQRLGQDTTKPQDILVGEDGATQARVWASPEIVVAKLYAYGTGEPTPEWLEKQPLERLEFLNQHKQSCANQERPPRIAEAFGGEHQWTSVHTPLVEKYSPLFFIDLHSYHVHTKGIVGKGMQINSHAEKKLDPIVRNALNAAQGAEPGTYGTRPPESENLSKYDKGWFFVSWGNPEPRGSYYCFEAKHWQKNQQEVTAKFIMDYLLLELQNPEMQKRLPK